MNHQVFCTCGEVIVKSTGEDTKIRAKIVVFKNSAAFAVCRGCDSDVRIPLQLDSDMLKSMVATQEPRHVPLYVRNAYKPR